MSKDTSGPPSSRHAWAMLTLLAIAMMVNLFHRGNLAVAAPVLASELKLSPVSLGLLLSGFYWTYCLCQIWAGWLVDRVDVRVVYTVGIIIWSLATFFSGIVTSFTLLLALRLFLGMGESVAYPASSRVLVATFPESRRGLANSLIDLGAKVGPALGTYVGGRLVASMGWRWLFLLTGGAGLVWLIPWLLVAPRATIVEKKVAGPQIGWADLLKRRAVWGTCGGLAGGTYAFSFLLSWLPSYLVAERHFSLNSMAAWAAAPYLLMAVTSIGGGVLADRLIARGAAAVPVRRWFVTIGLLLSGVLLPTVLIPRLELALAGLLLTCFSFGIYASNLWPLSQTLAGTEASGRWTGFQNSCGNLTGIIAPALTGWIVAQTGRFALAFLGGSLGCLCGAASFWWLVRESDTSRSTDDLHSVTVAQM